MNGPVFKLAQPFRISACVLIGQASLQNELLAHLIATHAGLPCEIHAHLHVDTALEANTALVLCDAAALSPELLEAEIARLHEQAAVIAIVNASEDASFEWLIHWPRVKGLFVTNTDEHQFLRGIDALIRNECWLPRRLMATLLEETRHAHMPAARECINLTPKEREILLAMISGARNAEIAERLHVSPHTIKTHLYNLFRKIKVNNRVQAVSWALANLEHKP